MTGERLPHDAVRGRSHDEVVKDVDLGVDPNLLSDIDGGFQAQADVGPAQGVVGTAVGLEVAAPPAWDRLADSGRALEFLRALDEGHPEGGADRCVPEGEVCLAEVHVVKKNASETEVAVEL